MNAFMKLFRQVRAANIVGEVWVNGSFLTQKIDPADIDFLLCVSADLYDNGTAEQHRLFTLIGEQGLRDQNHCDSYLLVEWATGHALHAAGADLRLYWQKQFGRDRSGRKKGIAVLPLEA